MNSSRQDTNQDSDEQPGWGKQPHWIWWLVLLALVVWNVFAFLPSRRPEVTIPYTAFLAQVQDGNVSHVDIVGSEITGTFVKPVLWPQPAATATAASSQTGSQAAATATVAATATAAAPTPTPQLYPTFTTTFPETIGDSNLLPLLEKQNVVVNVAPPPNPWLSLLFTSALPLLLLVGLFVWMGRQASQGQAGLFKFGRTKARKYEEHYPAVTFDDVAGADEAKDDLEEVVDFLRMPEKYQAIGARIPRGVLLVGPPGTGKTLLARAVSGEAGVPFYNISASEFVEMFVGVGASRVRDLFKQAKESAPAIVFIDELDAVGRRRGAGLGAVNDEREQTLNQLLVEMDGFDEHHQVIVLAATNRPDVLDPALQRPGRFDRQVEVAMPDRRGREGILHIHTKGLQLASDVDLSALARATIGFSGANSSEPVQRSCHQRGAPWAQERHATRLRGGYRQDRLGGQAAASARRARA